MFFISPEKCQVHEKKTYLTDRSGNCTTTMEHTIKYCAGTCPPSQTDLYLMVADEHQEQGATYFNTKCQCCSPILSEAIDTYDVQCKDGSSKIAHYVQIASCRCNTCYSTSKIQLY